MKIYLFIIIALMISGIIGYLITNNNSQTVKSKKTLSVFGKSFQLDSTKDTAMYITHNHLFSSKNVTIKHLRSKVDTHTKNNKLGGLYAEGIPWGKGAIKVFPNDVPTDPNNESDIPILTPSKPKSLNPLPILFTVDDTNYWLMISSPDSTGTYTVKFAKSQVHFINDSTFTFKISKHDTSN